jgi:predicted permease
MVTFRSLISKLSALFRRRELDQRVEEELEFHLRMQMEENIRRGLDPRDARRKLGNLTQVTEEVYRMNTISFLEETASNVRFSLRTFRRNPGFALTAVLVLALGLGASTAMFSALDRILFRPLPYPEESRLVHFGMVLPGLGGGEGRVALWAAPYPGSWKPAPEPLTAVTTLGVTGAPCDFTEQPPERLLCARVENNFLATFGVRPALGRDFTPEDDARGAPPVALISHELWTRRFGADRSIFSAAPGVVGRTFGLDGATVSVIGVLPEGFAIPGGDADIVQPQRLYPLPPGERIGAELTAFGRLRPGVTPEQAQAALAPIIESDSKVFFADGLQPRVTPLRDYMIGDAPRVAWLLLGAVASLLLIACVNVANLILARLSARNREFEVRSALGAGRGRLARLAMTESLLLAVAGGGLGLLLAAGMLRVFVGLAPSSIPEIQEATLDPRAFAVAGLLALAAGAAVGIWPALAVFRGRALQYGSRATSSGTGTAHPRMRFTLVTVQIAVTVALLGGSALLLRTLWNQVAVPLGYQSEQVFTMRVLLNPAFYQPGARDPFWARLLDRLRQMPGTVAATMTSGTPTDGFNSAEAAIAVDGQPPGPLAEGLRIRGRDTTAGYFETFRIPILQGRAFEESDRGQPTAVLSESAARLLFPGQDPIGHTIRRIRYSAPRTPGFQWAKVVGVAADVHNVEPTLAAEPEIYTLADNWGFRSSAAAFAVRTQASAADAVGLMKQAVADLDPVLPVTVEPMDEVVARQTQRPRFVAWLLSAFAGFALLLAAAGLYGVASYLVTQRTRDIGVRIALGADRAAISRQVVSEAVRWIAAGAVLGCALAWAGTRAIEAQLFEVSSRDPLSWIAALGVLCVVLLLAVLRPAARAARVDPMEALRAD